MGLHCFSQLFKYLQHKNFQMLHQMSKLSPVFESEAPFCFPAPSCSGYEGILCLSGSRTVFDDVSITELALAWCSS